MTYYALRSRKTGELLTCLAGTMADDDCELVSTSKRIIEIEGVIFVGGYAKKPIFVTEDFDFATLLVLAGQADDHRETVLFRPTFDVPRDDVDVVSFPDMAVVPTDNPSEEVMERLRQLRDAGMLP